MLSDKYIWYRDLIAVLTRKELAVRYKNNVLGYLWSLMNPLALAGVFYVVFGLYMRFDTPHYLIVLISALFPWQWFANSVGQAPFAFLANATLVKKVRFPRLIIPLVTNLQDMIHFLLALPIIVLFMLIDGVYPGWAWLYGVPLMLIVSMTTIFGISLLLSSVNLFFRDLGNLVSIITNVLFYATPIFYSLDKVPQQYHVYFKINPIAPLFISWRSLLFGSQIDLVYMPWATGYAVVFFVLGIYVYNRLHTKFAEVL